MIRHLLVEKGLSHNEIQLQLNLPAATYFRYLDILFQAEQEVIAGNNYTYQRLLNETLILQQRFLRRARRLEKLADDVSIDGETRRQAELDAAKCERAVHDMSYQAPSYLRRQGLLPDLDDNPEMTLTMSRLDTSEEPDATEMEKLKIAGEIRRENIRRQQKQEHNKEKEKVS